MSIIKSSTRSIKSWTTDSQRSLTCNSQHLLRMCSRNRCDSTHLLERCFLAKRSKRRGLATGRFLAVLNPHETSNVTHGFLQARSGSQLGSIIDRARLESLPTLFRNQRRTRHTEVEKKSHYTRSVNGSVTARRFQPKSIFKQLIVA